MTGWMPPRARSRVRMANAWVRAPGAELLTLEEHSRGVDAIAAGDADAAAAEMRAHLARSNALYRRIEEAQDRPS